MAVNDSSFCLVTGRTYTLASLTARKIPRRRRDPARPALQQVQPIDRSSPAEDVGLNREIEALRKQLIEWYPIVSRKEGRGKYTKGVKQIAADLNVTSTDVHRLFSTSPWSFTVTSRIRAAVTHKQNKGIPPALILVPQKKPVVAPKSRGRPPKPTWKLPKSFPSKSAEVDQSLWVRFKEEHAAGYFYWVARGLSVGIVILRREDYATFLPLEYQECPLDWPATLGTLQERYVHQEWSNGGSAVQSVKPQYRKGDGALRKLKHWHVTGDPTPFKVYTFTPVPLRGA